MFVDFFDQHLSTDLFSSRLIKARELRGLTQSALGEAAGLPGTSISHFESGARKPSFDNLRRLADKLEVSADYLMGRVDNPSEVVPDELAAHASKLTAADLALAVDFVQMLAKRRSGG